MKPICRHVDHSLTMELDQQARLLAASGRDIINLTAGQVDLPMPEEGKQAILDALREDRTGYVPATGSADLKAAVREHMGWHSGDILIGSGAKPLVHGAIQCLCGPGDQVLLPIPCYTSYPEMIRLSGAEPLLIPGDPKREFILSAEEMEPYITERTKALVLNHPVNPTGAVYEKEMLEQIVDLCVAHDLYIIADEVYSSFVYEGEFTSLYAFPKARERLVLVNGSSKTYAMAGLRIGFAVAPAAVAEAMGAYQSHEIGCPCSLSERAALAALTMQNRYERELVREFCARRDALAEALGQQSVIPIHKNRGAFYLWLDVSAWGDDMAFCRVLLEEEGVALTPGTAFCWPGFVRLAYTKKEPQLLEAAARICRFVQKGHNSDSDCNRWIPGSSPSAERTEIT